MDISGQTSLLTMFQRLLEMLNLRKSLVVREGEGLIWVIPRDLAKLDHSWPRLSSERRSGILRALLSRGYAIACSSSALNNPPLNMIVPSQVLAVARSMSEGMSNGTELLRELVATYRSVCEEDRKLIAGELAACCLAEIIAKWPELDDDERRRISRRYRDVSPEEDRATWVRTLSLADDDALSRAASVPQCPRGPQTSRSAPPSIDDPERPGVAVIPDAKGRPSGAVRFGSGDKSAVSLGSGSDAVTVMMSMTAVFARQSFSQEQKQAVSAWSGCPVGSPSLYQVYALAQMHWFKEAMEKGTKLPPALTRTAQLLRDGRALPPLPRPFSQEMQAILERQAELFYGFDGLGASRRPGCAALLGLISLLTTVFLLLAF